MRTKRALPLTSVAAALGVLLGMSACASAPTVMTYHYHYQINVHDETRLGYSHLYDDITITVDPNGTVMNFDSTLSSRGYGIEQYAASAHHDGQGSGYEGPTANVQGWKTNLASTSHWSLIEGYLGASWTFAHCTWTVQIVVQSGGGKVSSYAYPTNSWRGSCTGSQYLSQAT